MERGGQRGLGFAAIRSAPEFQPGNPLEKIRILDFEQFAPHAAGGKQPPFRVQDLDAIPAALDDPPVEGLAAIQLLLRAHAVGDVHAEADDPAFLLGVRNVPDLVAAEGLPLPGLEAPMHRLTGQRLFQVGTRFGPYLPDAQAHRLSVGEPDAAQPGAEGFAENAVGVDARGHHGRLLQDHPQQRVPRQQIVLAALAGGDVEGEATVEQDDAPLGARVGVEDHVAKAAVPMPQAGLEAPQLPVLGETPQHLRGPNPVGMEVGGVAPQIFGGRIPQEVELGAVGPQEDAVRGEQMGGERQGSERRPGSR